MSTSVLGLCYCWSFAPVSSWQRLRLPEEEGKNAASHWAGQRHWSTLSRSSFSPIPTVSRTPYRWPGSSQGQLCCLQLPPRRPPPRSPLAGLAPSCDFPGNTSEWKEMAIISYSYGSRTWMGFHGTNKRALLPPRSLCRLKPWRF